MREIRKSGSGRGVEAFPYGLNIVTLRKPKGRRNREHKANLKWERPYYAYSTNIQNLCHFILLKGSA